MTYTLNKPAEQRFFHSGVTWERFKALEEGFAIVSPTFPALVLSADEILRAGQ
jgi:hypothetical protein